MSATLRLFRIEARRSVARWLAVVMVGVTGFLVWSILEESAVRLWAESSVLVRGAATFFGGPLIAGGAAWMASRERRRGAEELLASVPFPEAPRRVITWSGALFWGIAAHLLIVAAVFAITAWEAPWGQPVLWPAMVGLLALALSSAIAYVLGVLMPSRFTPPLVAVAVFIGQDVGVERFVTMLNGLGAPSWLFALWPVGPLHNSVWYGIQPAIGPAQGLFLLGLTGLVLISLGLRRPRAFSNTRLAALCLLPAGLVLAALLLLARDPTLRWNGDDWAGAWPLVSYEPVCAGEQLTICLHPAYGPLLADLVPAVARMAAPLAAMPATPARIQQVPMADDDAEGVVVAGEVISLTLTTDSSMGQALYLVARGLVSDGSPPTPAQNVIALWLLEQAGLESRCDLAESSSSERAAFTADECAAAARFAALDAEAQRRWLEKHAVALRAGRLGLEALP